jgi:hypothetical protein
MLDVEVRHLVDESVSRVPGVPGNASKAGVGLAV